LPFRGRGSALHPLKGVGYSLESEPFPERPQRLDHPGKASVIPEEDQSPAVLIGHLLVVDQGAAHVKDLLQHRHIVGLPLDSVREEDVRLPSFQDRDGDLLDPEDYRARGEVICDFNPRLAIVRVSEDPLMR
jgi:hypothetical protein